MSCRGPILALAALACGMALASSGLAQKRSGGAAKSYHDTRAAKAPPAKTPIDEFETMSLGEQQRALRRLPPAQRQQLQQRLDQFNQLPPEQQRTLKDLYNRLHRLPADRQNAVRTAIRKFSLQPADRQNAIREELRGLAALPAEKRSERLASPEFRSKFSSKESDLVRDMAPLLPSSE